MSLPELETDHEGEARALLIDQFKSRPVIQGFLNSYVRELQEAENALWDLIDARILATATGDHLERIGDLVGEKRVGRSDTDYRTAIRIRIRVNRSKGRIVDVIDVAILAAPGLTPRVTEYRFLGFEVEIYGQTGERYVAELLAKTRAAGTYGFLNASDLELEDLLTFDDDVDPDPTLETFSDSVSETGLVCSSGYGLPTDFSGIVLVAAEVPAPDPAPTVTGITGPAVVDPDGGGERLLIDGTGFTLGCTCTIGGVAAAVMVFTDSTRIEVSPGAHASGVVDVIVTNPDLQASTGGTGLVEYFEPHDLGPTCELLPGAYSVTGVPLVNAVGTWTDASGEGNDAVSAGGVNAPGVSSGVPDFIAADSLHLSIASSLASSGGSPPDMATLTAGTMIAVFQPDASSGAASTYDDAVVAIGSGASAGIVYNDDGITWEAYDEGAFADYRRPTTVAAAVGDKHFAAARWSGSTWGCKVNAGSFNTVTADASGLSDGNVGASTMIGRSYAGARYYDGKIRVFLTFATALSDGDVDKIHEWALQRGYAE